MKSNATSLASLLGMLFLTGIAAAQEAATTATPVKPDRFRIGTEYIGAGTFHIMISGVVKGSLAAAGGVDAPAVTGATTGDMLLRSASAQKIILSANVASTGQFAFTPDGYLGVNTMSPVRPIHIVGPEGPVASFPTAAMGSRDMLILENNNNTNIGLIAGGNSYSSSIRFAKSADTVGSGAISYTFGDSTLAFAAGATERLRLTGTARAGFSTNAPISSIHQYTNTAANPVTAAITDAGGKDGLLTLNSGALGASGAGGGVLFGGNGPTQFFAGIKSLLANGAGNTTGDLAFATRNATADVALTERMRITSVGTVGIGTTSPNPIYKLHVNGAGRFEGPVTGTNIAAQYQDVAEWVLATDALAAGTVVVIDSITPNTVTASKSAYDTAVAGVVSIQPGISLGVAGPNKVQVATTGRVKVRADASSAPIRMGDLLVTSDIPGVVMRSEPMTVNGRTFHQPGTLVGKALEPLEKGSGEILVLLSLQ